MYFYGIGPDEGTVIEEEDAYNYALERCLCGSESDRKEFREMLVEWFFSGNWIRRDGSADQREADEDPVRDQSPEEFIQYLRGVQV